MTMTSKESIKRKIIFITVSIAAAILIIAGVMIGIIMSSDKNNDFGGVSSDDTALNNTASNENTISDTNSTNNSNNSTHSASGYSSTDSDVIPTVDLSTRAEKIVKTYEYIDEYNAPEFECLYFDDSVSGNKMPYALYVPENYDPGKKYPVLLYLHGAGEADNNTYDKIPQITVCGSDGSVLFTQSDITGALLATYNDSPALGIAFTDDTIKLLADAYRSDPNTEFTFNLGNNKLFAFKYTTTPTDNYVYLSGTYDYDTCDDLCSSLNKIVSKK